MDNLEILQNRSIIEIDGEDRKKFLQGLITNDVNKASANNLIYAVMLNAQGRFLFDFFIFEIDQKLMLDCESTRRDEILQKLNLYKLRSKVVLKKNDELKVFYSAINTNESLCFKDPRHSKLGFRIYKNSSTNSYPLSLTPYPLTRIFLKIPESEADLTYEKSLILEFGFDDLNAIDYQKGCYVGQELTARTHYRGEIRKKIFHVKISTSHCFEKNSEITCEGKSVGIILSSVSNESEQHALALIKLPDHNDFSNFLEKLEILGQKIFIVS